MSLWRFGFMIHGLQVKRYAVWHIKWKSDNHSLKNSKLNMFFFGKFIYSSNLTVVAFIWLCAIASISRNDMNAQVGARWNRSCNHDMVGSRLIGDWSCPRYLHFDQHPCEIMWNPLVSELVRSKVWRLGTDRCLPHTDTGWVRWQTDSWFPGVPLGILGCFMVCSKVLHKMHSNWGGCPSKDYPTMILWGWLSNIHIE